LPREFRRTHEIGVRMALGARPAAVSWLALRQGGAPVLVGSGVGVLSALWLGRYLSSMLYGVQAHDFMTLVAASGLLLASAALALAMPVHRAARVDPMEALRDLG
jgi:putative ABC transport system permease protein